MTDRAKDRLSEMKAYCKHYGDDFALCNQCFKQSLNDAYALGRADENAECVKCALSCPKGEENWHQHDICKGIAALIGSRMSGTGEGK